MQTSRPIRPPPELHPPWSLTALNPATLQIEYPERLSRGLVLVKWWLLAIPHYLVLAVLLGGGLAVASHDASYGIGLIDLLLGIHRWIFRVVAYVALMTDRYPPFRLDQGADEPAEASD